MRIEIPTQLNAIFVGQAGSSGSFTDNQTGEVVDYSEALAFDFDSADGNVQRLSVRANKIAEVARGGFDISKLKRYRDQVRITGNAVVNTEGKSFFKLIAIEPVAAA